MKFVRFCAPATLLIGVLATVLGPASGASARTASAVSCSTVRVQSTGLPRGTHARIVANGHLRALGAGRLEACAAGGGALTALPVTVRGTTYFPSQRGGPALTQPLVAGSARVDYTDTAPATTRVVDAARVIAVRGGQVVLRRADARGLRTGEVLVALRRDGSGVAVIRRVESVHRSGGVAVVATRSALPTAAFSRMSLRWASTQTGGTIEQLNDSCSAGGFSEITTGYARFNPSATFSLGWSFVDYVLPVVNGSATLTPDIGGGLKFKTNGAVSCTGTQQMNSVPIGVFSTEFGDFTFSMDVNLEVSGSADRAMSQKSGEKLTGSVGESFQFGASDSLTPTDTLQEGGWTSKKQPISPWLGGWTGSFGPSLGVQYGIAGVVGAGPEIGIADQETLNGGTTGWSLDGGLAATVGVDFSIQIPGTSLGVSWTDQYAYPLTTYLLRSKGWPGGGTA